MSQSGLIVRRKAGQFIPNAYTELAIKNNPTAFGAAISYDGSLMVSNGGKEDMNVEFFNSTQQEFKDSPITFYFNSSEPALDSDDLSPHVLLSDDNDEPLLAVFVEGNMPGFEKKDSSHPPTTHFITDWLVKKLDAVAELVDGDLSAIMTYLESEKFKNDLGKQFVSRGAITFMTKDKEFSLSIGDTSKEYPWGWVSNHYGFEMQAEKKEEPAQKKSMFAKKVVGPVAGNKPDDKPAVSNSTTLSKAPLYGIKKGRPEGNMSRKNRKSWYELRIGYYPQGGDQSCEIEYYVNNADGKLLTWAATKRMGLDAAGLPKLNNPPRMGADSNGNVTEPEHIPAAPQPNNQPQDPKVTTDALAILSPEQRTRTLAFIDQPQIKKIIAEGNVVATAEQAKAMEAKIAEVCTQLGRPDLKLMDFAKLPFPELNELGHKIGIHGMAVFTKNAFNMLAALIVKQKAKAEAEKEKEVTPTDSPQPEVEPEVEQPKRSMFAKKPKAA